MYELVFLPFALFGFEDTLTCLFDHWVLSSFHLCQDALSSVRHFFM